MGLFDYVLQHPDKPWSMTHLSENPNVTIGFVKSHLTDLPWDWKALSSNPCITLADIDANHDLPWDFNGLAIRKDLTLEFFEKHLNKPWDMTQISEKQFITLDFVDAHLDLLWDGTHLMRNPNMTMDYVINHVVPRYRHLDAQRRNWNWYYMHSNPKLAVEIMEAYVRSQAWFATSEPIMKFMNTYTEFPWWGKLVMRSLPWYKRIFDFEGIDYPWGLPWRQLSSNIPMEWVKNHMDLPWNWCELSDNKSLTMDFVEANLDKRWDWSRIATHNNLTKEFIEKHIDKLVIRPYGNFLGSPFQNRGKVSLELIENHPEIQWNWNELLNNDHIIITMDYVNAHPEIQWNWWLLGQNPGITMDDLELDKPWEKQMDMWMLILTNRGIIV